MLVVICEDDPVFREGLREKTQRWADQCNHQIHIQVFSSSEDMLEAWERGLPADIFFLDIQYKSEMNGIQAAKIIRETDQLVPIVFISITDIFSLEGYTVMALRYLQKPVSYEEIAHCLEIAFNRYASSQREFLILSESGLRYAIPIHEIKYIEAVSPMVRIVRDQNQTIMEIRTHFKDVLSLLPAGLFVQCHRSIIVNLMYVRSIRKKELMLCGNVSLPVSRMYADSVGQAFDSFYQEGGRFTRVESL